MYGSPPGEGDLQWSSMERQVGAMGLATAAARRSQLC